MPHIHEALTINAPIQTVFEALTTTEGIRNWWTRDAHINSRIGGTGDFAFFNHTVITKTELEEITAPTHILWKTISSNAPGGWSGTTIRFDLKEDGNTTKLTFDHRGFAKADEGYKKVSAGWKHYLNSLKTYLETGAGTPH